MSDFSAVVPTMASAARAAADATEHLTAQWQQLRGDVEAVLSGAWSGAAASAFARAWEEWDAGARAVVGALGELAERLGESGRAYAASDTEGAARFIRLSV